MDVTTLYSIGELSRRTGLSVRTIRFYSDSGVVAPTTRSPAGYRLYDLDALLRLELLRTLRELGMDLATIRRVLDRELSLAEVAAAHADAMDVRIRMLQLRRSVLRVVAGRGSDPEEIKLMHRLTQLSGEERRRLIDDFMEGTFGSVDADPAAAAMVRAAAPELPDDPSSEQVAAWVELAELVGDEGFRARMRRAAVCRAAGSTLDIESEAGEELMEFTRQKVAEAVESGIDPLSDSSAPIIDDLVHRFAEALARTPDPEFRHWMAQCFEEAHDPGVDRYWRLVWIVNDWQVVPNLIPVYPWLVQALRSDRGARSSQ
ncbi:MerR family transcriptional regulator [Streptomyces sp. JV185]|uniref:helix-turn-helix domain-containing protein n=1 Tax=Streptomyces sp. JV185 TaxID=858638 RepID=UPI002E765D79|nr:MerR family transcriptional regulator [Streptomyces sp. JV185]MEE1770201.1 MerR family transcriptional regulator [Streptomyces sp. JV185]